MSPKSRVFQRFPLKSASIMMSAIILGQPFLVDAADDPPSAEFRLVAPQELERVEGLGQVSVGTPIRSQEIYHSRNFDLLKGSPQAFEIFEIRLRPDGVRSAPEEVNYPNVMIRLATTTVDPLDLTASYEQNLANANAVVEVYNDSMATTTMNERLPNETMAFDSVITFQTPYEYSPDAGHLLFDLDMLAPDVEPLWDFSGDPGHGGATMLVGIATVNSRLEPAWTTPIQFSFRPVLPGDYDGSGSLDAGDIDTLSQAVGSNSPLLDVDQDGTVSEADRLLWIRQLAMTSLGDVDFNGVVEFKDFLALSDNFGKVGGWSDGDFNGDGMVGFPDFLLLSDNFGNPTAESPTSATSSTFLSVPEPSGYSSIVLIALVGAMRLPSASRRRQ